MSFDRLRTFLEVYRQGSMGRASEALGLTQPAVSQQIAALETEIGAPLFVRSRQGATPTPVADGLAREVAEPLDALEAATSARRSAASDVSGLVHLGAPPEAFSSCGPKMLATLAGSQVRVHVHLGNRKTLYHRLADGSLDIALTASEPSGLKLGSAVVGEEALWLVGHPDVARRFKGRRVDADALRALPLVAYDAELALVRPFFEAAFGERCEAVPTVTVPDLRTVVATCAALPAWSVAPDYVARPLIEGGALARLTNDSVANPFRLVWRRAALRTPRVAFAKARFLSVFGL